MAYFNPEHLPREPADVREARRDARLLLRVVRAKLREGRIPVEHLGDLAELVTDERLTLRLRMRVATAMLDCRMLVLERALPAPGDGGNPAEA